MIKDLTYACPECTKQIKVKGSLSTLLACSNCGAVVQNETGYTLSKTKTPDDWTLVQIGTTGVYKEKTFEVIGRIHLQLRREYLDFWCLWIEKDKSYAWLVESFGIYTFCKDSTFEFDESSKIKLNKLLTIVKDVSVTIDLVDRCEYIGYSGEIRGWKDFSPGFSLAQGNKNPNITAFFLYDHKVSKHHFLVGEWTDFDSLQLQHTRVGDPKKTSKALTSVKCPECKHEHFPRGKDLTLAMTCDSCGKYFTIGNWSKEVVKFNDTGVPSLIIGEKGKFNGSDYEVMGFVVKHVRRYNYKWREYFLFNPEKGRAYLSEYNGHWNFLLPIRDNPKSSKAITDFYYDASEFRLYQKFRADIVYGKGEFFSDIFSIAENTSCEEYIAPPYLLSFESDQDSRQWYKGEYKSQGDIASAFGISASMLPKKQGRGYTQPLLELFKTESLIRLYLGILIVIIGLQIFFEQNSNEKVAYQKTFNAKDIKGEQKMFVTPSFFLEGSSKSLVVNLTAPISNDWFYGDFTLINDSDQTEYNFSKEIEYYYGYEGGESWSEGSKNGEAFLSRIPEGRYHINIYPEFSPTNNEFSISVVRDVTNISNMWISLLIVSVFPVSYFIRKYYVEKERWSDSDYSPYDQ